MRHKVDVVVCFYKQHDYWPLLRWGFEENRENISRVIVVNDGFPSEVRSLSLSLPLERLGHPRKGFGLCRSANQGIAAARTDYVLLMEGDEVLAPESLEHSLEYAAPGVLLCGRKRYLSADTKVADLPPREFIENDHREEKWRWRASRASRWRMCSGGHLLLDREAHTAIGGFDERYGYGLHDYDYAARWMTHFSPESVMFGPFLGEVWHIGSGKGRPLPSKESVVLFEETKKRCSERL